MREVRYSLLDLNRYGASKEEHVRRVLVTLEGMGIRGYWDRMNDEVVFRVDEPGHVLTDGRPEVGRLPAGYVGDDVPLVEVV